VPPDGAIDPVDLAAKLNIQVHFEPLRSLEGLYVVGKQPRIILGSDRPSGRRNFTCAHEIGHAAHGHGSHVDEYCPHKKPYDPEEFAADRFAAALLMPKIAVEAAFAHRGLDERNASPEQLFTVASEFGVGYSTLAGYLSGTLELISSSHAKRLARERPQQIRAALAGRSVEHHLVVVDRGWRRTELNLEVGDVALLNGSVDDPEGHIRVSPGESGGALELTPLSPGEARFSTPNCSGTIRIAPRCYKGLADYRYLSASPTSQEAALV
jgi:Zn-dependent peptidase ImmA (M78 family)